MDSADFGIEKQTLLVVDDVPTNILLLETILKKEGFLVITANCGEKALQQSKSMNPDLILLDVMMPGMDGFEVLTHLKSDDSTKYIPVIMITALSDPASTKRAAELGAADFLSKPFQRTLLTSYVQRHLPHK